MLEFEWPWTFLLMPLPLLVWWLIPPYRDQQTSVHVPFFERIAEATGQTPQPGAVVLRRRAIQMLVAAVIWILIVVALARPQQVGEPVTHEVSARDLILAVDISGSMDQADFRTSDGKTMRRLDGVKRSCLILSLNAGCEFQTNKNDLQSRGCHDRVRVR